MLPLTVPRSLQILARLVHAEPGSRIVEVTALRGEQCLGSALAEADHVETAEERALQRLMALLIYPQLMACPGGTSSSLATHERVALDDLVAAIRADLPGPWNLTRMERHAGLSRPQLQRLFQISFHCTPLEWLRHQRLCWART